MDSQINPEGGTPSRTSGYAIASLVMGIVSLALCCCPFNIPAIILGIIALAVIRDSGRALKGRHHAIAGIVTGAISLVISAVVLFWIFGTPSGLMFGDQIPSKYRDYMSAQGFLEKGETLVGLYDEGLPWTHEGIFMTDRKIGSYLEKDLNAVSFEEVEGLDYKEGGIVEGDRLDVRDRKGNVYSLKLPGMGDGRRLYEKAHQEWLRRGGGGGDTVTPEKNE